MAQIDGTYVSGAPEAASKPGRRAVRGLFAGPPLRVFGHRVFALWACLSLTSCLGFGPAVEVGENERVTVTLVGPSGKAWSVAHDPNRSRAQISAEAGENEKYGTAAEVQRLVDALEEADFFDGAEAIRTPPGGFLSIERVDEDGDYEVFTLMQPSTGDDETRRYALCRDQFFNEGFNSITTMRPSGDPQSFLRDIERRSR